MGDGRGRDRRVSTFDYRWISTGQLRFGLYVEVQKEHQDEVDAILKGTNVTNEISVTVNDTKATLVVNGKKMIEFSGQPPEGGSLIGFTFGTLKNDPGPTIFTLKSIEVHEVQPATVGMAQP